MRGPIAVSGIGAATGLAPERTRQLTALIIDAHATLSLALVPKPRSSRRPPRCFVRSHKSTHRKPETKQPPASPMLALTRISHHDGLDGKNFRNGAGFEGGSGWCWRERLIGATKTAKDSGLSRWKTFLTNFRERLRRAVSAASAFQVKL